MKKIPMIIQGLKDGTLDFTQLSIGYQVQEPISEVAVTLDGKYLLLLADAQRKNKDLVTKAIISNPIAYNYAMGNLKNDNKIIELVLNHSIIDITSLYEISVKFPLDQNLIEKVKKRINQYTRSTLIGFETGLEYIDKFDFNNDIQMMFLNNLSYQVIKSNFNLNGKNYEKLKLYIVDKKIVNTVGFINTLKLIHFRY